jgi:5-methylcytosine-specific restriction endonuclease McrA
MAYSNYLQSSHWKKTREIKLTDCGHCQICGATKKLHIHHLRYRHNKNDQIVKAGLVTAGSILGKENKGDLFVLCSICHGYWHFYYGKKYLRHKIASKIRRLVKLGVKPKYAFMFSVQPNGYTSLLNYLKERDNTN